MTLLQVPQVREPHVTSAGAADLVFQHAASAMLILDQHGLVQAINPAATRLLHALALIPDSLLRQPLGLLLDSRSAAACSTIFDAARATPEPVRLSVQLQASATSYQPCELFCSPLLYPAPIPLQWLCVLTLAEPQAATPQPQPHPLAHPTPPAAPISPDAAVLFFDRSLCYTLVEGAERLWGGIPKAQIERHFLWEVFPAQIAITLEQAYRAALSGTVQHLTRYVGERTFFVYVLPVRNKQGQVVGGMDVTFDASEQARLQLALAQRTAEHRILLRAVEQSSSSIIITSREGQVEYVNAKFCEVTGYTPDEVLGQNPRFLKSGAMSPDEYRQMWETLLSGGQWHGEFHNRRKDGSMFWELAALSPITDEHGAVTHYLAVKEDITARKQMEEHLIESLSLLRATVESTSDGLMVLADSGNMILANRRMSEIWGLPHTWEETYTAERIFAYIEPLLQDAEPLRVTLAHLAENFTDTANGLFVLHSGQIIEYTATPYTVNTHVLGRVWNFRDVTSQRQTEMSLRESEALLSTIFHVVDVGITMTDEKGLFVLVNPSFCRTFGYTEQELIGQSFTLMLLAATHADVLDLYQRGLRGEANAPSEWQMLHKDGHLLTMLATFGLITRADNRLYTIVTLTDITPRKDYELALQKSEERYQVLARQNARLFAAARRRADEAETLYEASAVITASLNQAETLNRILDQLVRVVPYSSASVQLREGDVSVVIAGRGFSDVAQELDARYLITDGTVNYIVYREQCPLLLADAREGKSFFQRPSAEIRSWLGLPLIIRGEVIGMLTLDHHTAGYFTEKHSALGMAFANQVAIALENARLFERMQHLASTDALTGLWNRGHFFDQAQRVFTGAQTQHTDLTVILMDIDNFKWVNDTFGHIAGDEALRTVAQKSRSMMRGTDLIGRYGGEEIITLLPHTDASLGYRIAERLRVALARTMIHTDQGTLSLTASFGLAIYTPDDKDANLETVIDRADRALAFAKRSGKNRVVAWSPEMILPEMPQFSGANQQTFQRRAEAILRVSTRLNTNLDLPTLLETICKETLRSIRVNVASIHFYEPERDVLKLVEIVGVPTEYKKQVQPFPMPIYRGLHGNAPVMVIPDLLDAAEFPNTPLYRQYDLRTFAGATMYHAGKLIGVLGIGTRNAVHSFKPDELELLRVLAEQAALAINNARLFSDLSDAYTATLQGWARAVDLRDHDTAAHSFRVTEMTVRLAQAMGIGEPELTHIRRGALLHDVGKLGVPDRILLKQGALDDDEWAAMRQHPQYAYDLLYPITFLRPALDIPHYHHERWDGSGYPHGLQGPQIPLVARIFAVVDVWDALCFDRPYRKAWPEAQVRNYLRHNAGVLFDPEVVAMFFRILEHHHTNLPDVW
ncbi:MAG: PAS domain S-box protein [Chloroflexaceae bacterium]|nr:PAS domain S-box protein [Chloroflexaceae bacterium]